MMISVKMCVQPCTFISAAYTLNSSQPITSSLQPVVSPLGIKGDLPDRLETQTLVRIQDLHSKNLWTTACSFGSLSPHLLAHSWSCFPQPLMHSVLILKCYMLLHMVLHMLFPPLGMPFPPSVCLKNSQLKLCSS